MKSQRYARQAIQTKYLGPTNFRGSRIKAWAQAGSVIVSKDYGLSNYEEHERAALALQAKYDWQGELHAGALPNGDYAWVLIEGDHTENSGGVDFTPLIKALTQVKRSIKEGEDK